MYKILGSDRKEYGPATADQVRQWIAEGRINGQTQVQQEGSGDWKPLSAFAEFSAVLTVRTANPGQTRAASPPLPPLPASSNPGSGLAVTSFVLGILSVIGCAILTAMPAIITGHVAHNRSRKAPQKYGGGGLAIAGFVLGYASLVFVPIFAAMLLPALAKAKGKAQQIQCVNNMKQIGLAARIWATDHGDKFPPDFVSMSGELATPKVLICPGDGSRTSVMDWAEFGPDNVSYDFLEPGIEVNDAAGTIVFQCPVHGNMGMGDGSVQMGRQPGRRNRR